MSLKKVILVFSLCFAMLSVTAQLNEKKQLASSNEVRAEISTGLAAGSISRVLEAIGQLPRPQRFLLFSVIIRTDGVGSVNRVDFTNKSSLIEEFSYYDKVTRYLKTDKNKVFRKHKNTTYMVSVLIRDADNYTIDVTLDFIKSFKELVPLTISEKNRTLVVLPAIDYSVINKH